MKSKTKNASSQEHKPFSIWLRVVAVAAGSAFAGGIAAAWFYRKTLEDLRRAEIEANNSDFGIFPDHQGEDF